MPRKIETKNEDIKDEELFFEKLSKTCKEPEPWPITTEGELAVDVCETAKEIVVRAAIAGVKADDLNLSLNEDLLTIRGFREGKEDDEHVYLCKECYWGPFSRSIILPSPVKTDKAKAELQRGILTIVLPKAKKEASIKITNLGE